MPAEVRSGHCGGGWEVGAPFAHRRVRVRDGGRGWGHSHASGKQSGPNWRPRLVWSHMSPLNRRRRRIPPPSAVAPPRRRDHRASASGGSGTAECRERSGIGAENTFCCAKCLTLTGTPPPSAQFVPDLHSVQCVHTHTPPPPPSIVWPQLVVWCGCAPSLSPPLPSTVSHSSLFTRTRIWQRKKKRASATPRNTRSEEEHRW